MHIIIWKTSLNLNNKKKNAFSLSLLKLVIINTLIFKVKVFFYALLTAQKTNNSASVREEKEQQKAKM